MGTYDLRETLQAWTTDALFSVVKILTKRLTAQRCLELGLGPMPPRV